MLRKGSIIIFLCFVACAWSQTYKELGYTDCGSRNVKINNLKVTPMPILHPGKAKLEFSASTTTNIKGVIKADVNIIRKVSGIALPIRCYVVEGENVGSCSYPDLCALMKRLVPQEPGKCPPNLAPHGIDCNCPVNIITNDLTISMDLDIPETPKTVEWLSVGDFDVNLKATAGTIYGCYDLKFSVKPSP